MGQNITRIIPKCIGEFHDAFIKEFLEDDVKNSAFYESRLVNKERLVFP